MQAVHPDRYHYGFRWKKPAGGFKHLSSDIQALEEFSRKPKEDTVKYKFTENYS